MVDIIESREDAIASYPYDSLEEGFGLVTYYLYASEDSASKEYRIGKDLDYSAEVGILKDDGGGPSTNTTTFYSGTFARPRTINGTVKFNFCTQGQEHGGGDNYYFEIKFYHYDGTTSTQLGSTWTSATDQMVSSPGQIMVFNGDINISSKKFRAGDQMKIEVILQSNFTAGTPHSVLEYGIDPQNRDGVRIKPSTDNEAFTQFIVRVPFRLVN
jgi:hypothetical protein